MSLPRDIKRQYLLALDLNHAIKQGNRARAEALLAAGAPVNGSNLMEYAPLTFIAVCGGVELARLFVERGSDLDAGVNQDILDSSGRLSVKRGTCALTMAIRNCHVDVFELLVEAGANLNAADCTGFTPLMSASMGVEEAEKGVVMAKALLLAGADPWQTNDEGCIALTYAAAEGSADVVDMLLERAPNTVSHVTSAGSTPLYGAACTGNVAAAVRLLAAGAVQPSLYQPSYCPLLQAVLDDNTGLVRVLARHAKAVGGDAAVQTAIEVSMVKRRARILQMLLLSGGEKRQELWANCRLSDGSIILHDAASSGTLGMLSALLSAGADETRLDGNGRTALEAVRTSPCKDYFVTEEEAAAMRRMLLRGAAFRARSWAWRAGVTGATALRGGCGGAGGAGGGSDGDPYGAGRSRRKAPPAVRIYRPENKVFFVRHVGRYSLKE